jgi:hypothetical protein
LNYFTQNRTSTNTFQQQKLLQRETSNSQINAGNDNFLKNKISNLNNLIKSEKSSSENNNNENKNFFIQKNTRSFSFKNIKTKFDNKNKLSIALLNNINLGLNSDKSLQKFINTNNFEQDNRQNMNYSSNKRVKDNKTANYFYNINENEYISSYNNSNKNLDVKFKNSIYNKISNKDYLFIENSKRNFFINGIYEKQFNDGFNSNKNIIPYMCESKKAIEKTTNKNSGLKIPNNFLKFNSDLFSDGNNFNHNNNNKITFENYKTNKSNFFLNN